MGHMIHFDREIVGADELRLIETKKAILEKLKVRFGFDYAAPKPGVATAKTLATKQTSFPKIISRAR